MMQKAPREDADQNEVINRHKKEITFLRFEIDHLLEENKRLRTGSARNILKSKGTEFRALSDGGEQPPSEASESKDSVKSGNTYSPYTECSSIGSSSSKGSWKRQNSEEEATRTFSDKNNIKRYRRVRRALASSKSSQFVELRKTIQDILTGTTQVSEKLQMERVVPLPRGGYYVKTKAGPIQFGVPPETIKDSMKLGMEIPEYYVIPPEPFNITYGLSLCEIEFPCYFNFFIKKTSTTVIADPAAKESVKQFFTETLEGPIDHLYIDEDYTSDCPEHVWNARPDLKKEIEFFKEPRGGRIISVDTLLSFKDYEKVSKSTENHISDVLRQAAGSKLGTSLDRIASGEDHLPIEYVKISDSVILVKYNEKYYIIEDGQLVTSLDESLLNVIVPLKTHMEKPCQFLPPTFGVTVLGSSSGFDGNGITSGFILWVNGHGIMVDPPPHSSDMVLRTAGIPYHLIRHVILTHCHADHDAGTFQKLLTEKRATLITTETIMRQFTRKYSWISGFSNSFLSDLFSFEAVKIGQPMFILGCRFNFSYSMHILPCICFKAQYLGKSITYSADTLLEPKILGTLHERGILSKERMEALLDFDFDCNLVIHEAGIPPTHTPWKALSEMLTDEQKKNLYLIHTTEKSIAGSGFRIIPRGVANTVKVYKDKTELSQASQVVRMLHAVDLFKDTTVEQLANILSLCHKGRYPPNHVIHSYRDDVLSDSAFVMIFCGICEVTTDASGSNIMKKSKIKKKVQTISEEKEGKDEEEEGKSTEMTSPSASLSAQLSRNAVETALQYSSPKKTHGSTSSSSSNISKSSRSNNSRRFSRNLGHGNHFLLDSSPKSLVTVTAVETIEISREAFDDLLRTYSSLRVRAQRLRRMVDDPSYLSLLANSLFSRLTYSQMSQIQISMTEKIVKKGDIIFRQNENASFVVFIGEGEFEVREAKERLRVHKGCYIGDVNALEYEKCNVVSVFAKTNGLIFTISRDEFLATLDDMPGLYVKLFGKYIIQ